MSVVWWIINQIQDRWIFIPQGFQETRVATEGVEDHWSFDITLDVVKVKLLNGVLSDEISDLIFFGYI